MFEFLSKKKNQQYDPFHIPDYEEWVSEYEALKAEGKKQWAATGLPSDIRKGWQESAKENKLFACGPYSVPLDVVENIEADTRWMLAMAGIKKMPESKGFDPGYIDELKSKSSLLEKQLKKKDKEIGTLLELISELRHNQQEAAKKKAAHDMMNEEQLEKEYKNESYLAGTDEIDLF